MDFCWGMAKDPFVEQVEKEYGGYRVTLGISRIDAIIKHGGLLDTHFNNLRKYGPDYGKHLSEVVFPKLEAKCYELMQDEPLEVKTEKGIQVKEAFKRAYSTLDLFRSAALYDHLHMDAPYLIKVLTDLISFKTVAPPGDCYNEIVDYLIPIFSQLGFDVEKVVIPPIVFDEMCPFEELVGDRVNLRARMDVGAKETLIIYTHLDVVPPGRGWTIDPFELAIIGNKVYGRGVSDSKGAVAALIAAIQAIEKHGRLRYNLEILLTTDEEVGGYSGLCYMADSGLIEGSHMLCMDGYSDDVVIGCNGIITWEVAVHGKSAHSAASFLGENAIEKALPVIDAIMAHKEDVESRRSSLAANSVLEKIGIEHLMPILNITIIAGGIKENIVPDSCILRGDRRVIPEESMEEAAAEIENVVANLGIDLDWNWWYGYPPMRMDPDHSWVSEVAAAVEKVTGEMPKLSGAQVSLDQAYFAEVTGIPACVYGIGRQMESNAHGADENVRIDDLVSYSKFLAKLMIH
jgi:succinyl-diaminopimelate desuccinylase